MEKKLICPKCHKKGFDVRELWNTSEGLLLKCSECGEWSCKREWTTPLTETKRLQHIATKNHIRGEIMRQWDDDERVSVREVLAILDAATFDKTIT